MLLSTLLISIVLLTTGVTITEPVDGETYDGDWLTVRAIVENENDLPDSVHYTLNGEPVIEIPRLNTDWPTYMQNYQNHGYSESPAPMTNNILWTAPVTGEFHEFPTPVVVEGMVFYTADSIGEGTTDSLYALNAATGELIWKYNTGYADDAVTVTEGRVYSASDSIFCLDALTGELIWVNGVADRTGSTPIVMDGSVYCMTQSTMCPDSADVYALDALSGAVIWHNRIYCIAVSCLGLSDGLLIIPSFFPNNSLFALNCETGSIVWENNDFNYGFWDSSPTIVESNIFIIEAVDSTYCIDLYSGEILWSQITSGGTATIAYQNSRLYFASEYPPYRCMESENGTTLWTADYSQHGSSGVADGVVFFGTNRSFGTPDSAEVVALDCETGSTIWTYATSSGGPYPGFQGSPSIVDGVMYYPCTDGYLYAFGTGLKYTYLDDLYAQVGSNELVVTSFNGGAVAADTISFTVTGTGINLEPSRLFGLTASPNPFISTASISFDLSEVGFTSVQIFDLSGRMVSSLIDSELLQGTYTVQWNGCNQTGEEVSAGLYLCRIESDGVIETTGMCLLK